MFAPIEVKSSETKTQDQFMHQNFGVKIKLRKSSWQKLNMLKTYKRRIVPAEKKRTTITVNGRF